MHRRIAALTLAVVATFGLSACTGSPAPASSVSAPAGGSSASQESTDSGAEGGQTVSEACALVHDTISEATGQFDQATEQDPAVVVEAMRNAADQLGETALQVTNTEVAALLPPLQEMFTQVSEVMEALVAGDTSRLTELSELGTDFQQTVQRFQELCAPA